MQRPLNIGVIGLGFMGVAHIKAWRQLTEARVAALCNPSGRHLDGDFSDVSGNVGDNQPLKLDMQGISAYRDYDAMLGDGSLDVIDICTPTHTHRDLAVQALEAGKHVVCEKPFARTSNEAREMIAAARQAQRTLMPAMCLRFWPGWAWLKEVTTAGTYGRILSARFTRIAEPPGWGRSTFLDGEKSGGALLDLHIHDADFVQYLFGRPLAVESTGYTRLSGCIDHVVTRYEVPGGAMVHAEGGWTLAKGFGFRMAYTVNFENATADYDLTRGDDALKLSENGETRVIPCGGTDGIAKELAHFTESVLAGKPPAVVTAEDGVASVEFCELEERSIKEARRIAIPPA